MKKLLLKDKDGNSLKGKEAMEEMKRLKANSGIDPSANGNADKEVSPDDIDVDEAMEDNTLTPEIRAHADSFIGSDKKSIASAGPADLSKLSISGGGSVWIERPSVAPTLAQRTEGIALTNRPSQLVVSF